MNLQILIPITIVLIVGTIFYLVYYFSRKAVVKRKLKKAVESKISDFISGDIAKVVGTVEFVGEPLIAPLSGRQCAYYYVLVEELISDGKNSHWRKMIEREVGGKFVIRDGRHRAYISTDSTIKSYIVMDKKYSSGFMENATENLEKFLQNHGQTSKGFLGINRKIRYKEGVLEAGECIAVMGKGEWKTAAAVQLPDTFGRVLVISTTEAEPVYLSDDPDTVKTKYNDLLGLNETRI